MPIREPTEDDKDWIRQAIDSAYSREGWTDDDIEQKLRNEEGVIHVEPTKRIFVTVQYYHVPHDIYGVIPAGWSTQVKDMIPLHHDADYMSNELAPELLIALEEVGRRDSDSLRQPVYGKISASLAVHMGNSILATDSVVSRSGERALVYVDTLGALIRRLQ